jgi:hypothetical protein
MITKKKMNRRDAMLLAAKGAAIAQVGVGVIHMGADLMPKVGPFDKIRKILQAGDLKALAQAATPATYPVIQICLIDKIQQALLLTTPGAEAPATGDLIGFAGVAQNYKGIDISGQATTNITFRGMNLTTLFGQRLSSGLAAGYNVAFFPQFTSNSGGHTLMNSDMGSDIGGLNYLIESEGQGTGILGAVGFAVRADANNSRDSFVAPGRIPMQTYDSAAQVRATLKNSVAALNSPEKFLDFRRSLDLLAHEDDNTLETLQAVKELVNPTLTPLQNAVLAPNIVEQQLSTIITLAQAGLASNFMLAIPWDDTNGGGNLTTAGGQSQISPYIGTAMLADIFTTLSTQLPNAVAVVVSDGGRSRNNGDAAGGMTIVSGPAAVINNGIFGRPADMATLGNANATGAAGSDIILSDGSTIRVLEHKHILALIAKLTHGIATEVPYPVSVNGERISNLI